MSIRRSVAVTLILCLCTTAALAQPANDNCIDAIPILDGITAFSTVGATTDGPANAICAVSGDGGQTFEDIWFEYTATCSGELTVSTCNLINYDSDLVIYDGCDCGALNFLACNDDGVGCAGFSSNLVVDVVAGNCYLIRVGGWNTGNEGSGDISITCAPDLIGACCLGNGTCLNVLADDCSAQGGSFIAPGQSCDEVFGPGNGCTGACCTGEVCTLTTQLGCAGVFVGYNTNCDNLPCNHGACCTFDGFCVDDQSPFDCAGILNGQFLGPDTLCANSVCAADECIAAQQVQCGQNYVMTNQFATASPGDPNVPCYGGAGGEPGFHTVWAYFDATHTDARISLCNSPVLVDSVLAVYSVDELDPCNSLTPIACNEDFNGPNCALTSEVCAQNLVVGERYYIEVVSFDDLDSGEFLLTLECPCRPCYNACPGDVNEDGKRDGEDLQAVVDCYLGDPTQCPCLDIDNSGQLDLADIETQLVALYLASDACPVGACCIDDGVGTCLDITEQACEAQAGNWRGEGTNCAAINCPQPLSNDDCVDAILIECNTITDGINSGANWDGPPAEPDLPCKFQQLNNTVWYKFVATDTTARATTCMSIDVPPGTGIRDSIGGIFSGECGSLVFADGQNFDADNNPINIACGEDDCTGGRDPNNGWMTIIRAENLVIGQTYHIMIGAFGELDSGRFMLQLDCPDPTP